MDTALPNLEELLRLAQQLTPLEKLQLIERLTPDLAAALATDQPSPVRRRGMRGLLRGCRISADDIDQARRELWAGFPREDT